ncbi:MAG: VCBS repeat-containing protein [Vicinamibacterales bacterium]
MTSPVKPLSRTFGASAVLAFAVAAPLLVATPAHAAGTTRYVRTTGTDAGTCANQASPCRTITYGISQMAGGDTLTVGNGTYTSTTNVNAIRYVPSGNAGPDGTPGTPDDVYTTVMAETDFGVLIDGRQWSVPDTIGLNIWGSSYIKIRGFKIFSAFPGAVIASHHVKVIRNAFAYANTTGNVTTMAVGPGSDYVLLEENYAYGGARYQFLVYQSTRTVVRRNVARNDYYNDLWQSAAFANYDSTKTVWENNIAIDADNSCCPNHAGLWGGFWNENAAGDAEDTSEELRGNIVLNYRTRYQSNLDWNASGNHALDNNIFWDGVGGYWGAQGPGTPATITLSQMTIGAMKLVNQGTGGAVYIGPGIPNTIRNSIIANNFHGLEGYAHGNYNAFSGNTANYGGNYDTGYVTPTAGANDINNLNIVGNILKYLPRGPESGSALTNAGEGGARVGAQVLWKIGLDGTLYGESGYGLVRSPETGYGRIEDSLWPFPNEDVIKTDMAAYAGPGLPGARGFAAPGNALYGGPRTLTSYIWEYLGFPCPVTVCRGGRNTKADADGDGKTDITIFRPSTNAWWILKSSGAFATYSNSTWGVPGDVPEPGDYDGDGKLDLAVYRPSTLQWWVLWSSTNFSTYNVYGWGLNGDKPKPADYDGDGKTDIAVYRPTTGGWWILKSSTGFATYSTYGWGLAGDVAVPGDYDGDGKADPAVYRPTNGTWWVLKSSGNFATYSTYGWGLIGDVAVPGDYDGDGKMDVAIYRPTTGGWWILKSSGNFNTYSTYGWGLIGDVPVPGDYDGDGKMDVAIYRPSTGGWWILKSSGNYNTYSTYGWGLSGDVPVVTIP